MALPILAAAARLAANAGKTKLVQSAKDSVSGVFNNEVGGASPLVLKILVGVETLGVILMLAVAGGQAGELTGVNNPRGEVECGPGEACEEIPPSTGDCAGIVATANAELAAGVVETSEDTGPRIREYTDNNVEPWCADFVSWVLWQSGNKLDPGPASYEYSKDRTAGRESAVVNLSSYYSRFEIFIPPGTGVDLMPGDVVFFNWSSCEGGTKQRTHTGIIADYDASSKVITTIEGNKGVDGREGVGARRISISNPCITGFGRLRNCQAAATVPKSTTPTPQ
jgi:hypothetical protein